MCVLVLFPGLLNSVRRFIALIDRMVWTRVAYACDCACACPCACVLLYVCFAMLVTFCVRASALLSSLCLLSLQSIFVCHRVTCVVLLRVLKTCALFSFVKIVCESTETAPITMT